MSGRSGSRSDRSRARRAARRLSLVAALAAALLTAPGAGAQSLWTARSGSLVTDLRAGRAGDLITIVIDEQSVASKNADTELKRDSSFSSGFNPPTFQYPSWLAKILFNLSASGFGKSNYKGSGNSARTDKATATITAKVARVLDNGNLLIEGRRLVVLHDETLTVVVSGLVRPQDVGADNLVRSSAIADAEIRIEGQGAISQRQRPGIFQRLFDWMGAF